MNAEDFIAWLAEMKAANLARSDAACARLLKVSTNTILAMKANGADMRTALACRALLHRMRPYRPDPVIDAEPAPEPEPEAQEAA
jgi:streptomycin 6-kinase